MLAPLIQFMKDGITNYYDFWREGLKKSHVKIASQNQKAASMKFNGFKLGKVGTHAS